MQTIELRAEANEARVVLAVNVARDAAALRAEANEARVTLDAHEDGRTEV